MLETDKGGEIDILVKNGIEEERKELEPRERERREKRGKRKMG